MNRPHRTAAHEGGRKPVAVVAEDDVDLAQALTLKLRRAGFEVFRSPDAAHALVGIQRARPDVAVVDIEMPGGNGLAVCEMLRDDPATAEIPLIVHSGKADETLDRRAAEMNASFVRKEPGSIDRVVAQASESVRPAAGPAKPTVGDRVATFFGMGRGKNGPADPAEQPSARLPEIPLPGALRPAPVEPVLDPEPADPDAPADPEAFGAGVFDAAAPPEPAAPPLVLLVEDDADFARVLATRLERCGLRIVVTADGESALRLAEEHAPDAIITDLVLREAEGAYIVRRFRDHETLSGLPIFVLTGQPYPEIQRQVMSLGVDAFFTKPVSVKRLLAELRFHVPVPEVEVDAEANWVGVSPREVASV